jgi:hypothetical protein
MSVFFAEAEEAVLDGNYSRPFGVGFECELIQRAAKAQIIKFLPDIQENIQEIWDRRDQEFCEKFNLSYKKLKVPRVSTENIYSGIENISLIEAPLERWPNILIYARNGNSYQYQEDQFDTSSITLCIEVLCSEGPIKAEELHNKEGLEAMESLDSKLHRLSDSIYMCIQKDKTLSGSIGQFEKPPKVTTSLPWSRKESTDATGEIYFIFQGKQFEFSTQKITL